MDEWTCLNRNPSLECEILIGFTDTAVEMCEKVYCFWVGSGEDWENMMMGFVWKTLAFFRNMIWSVSCETMLS